MRLDIRLKDKTIWQLAKIIRRCNRHKRGIWHQTKKLTAKGGIISPTTESQLVYWHRKAAALARLAKAAHNIASMRAIPVGSSIVGK